MTRHAWHAHKGTRRRRQLLSEALCLFERVLVRAVLRSPVLDKSMPAMKGGREELYENSGWARGQEGGGCKGRIRIAGFWGAAGGKRKISVDAERCRSTGHWAPRAKRLLCGAGERAERSASPKLNLRILQCSASGSRPGKSTE